MEGSATPIVEPESKVASTVEGDATPITEEGDDSTPVSKFASTVEGDGTSIKEGGDDSTPISKFLLIMRPKSKTNLHRGVDYFSNMSRRTTSIPRLPAPYLVFMEQFLEPYVKVKRFKGRTLVAALSACGFKWTSFSETEKEPYRVESSRRMVLYEKQRAVFDRLVYDMEPPSEDEFDEELCYQFLSPFSIFVECEVVLIGTRLTTYKSAYGMWNSMSSEEKSIFVTLAANRMKMHELMSIEFFAHLLDKYRNGNDSESFDDAEGTDTESLEAKNGILVFLEEFMHECDDEEKVLDPEKSGQLLIEEQVQEWDMMTEDEQGPYQAEAERLMAIYDRRAFKYCVRMSRTSAIN